MNSELIGANSPTLPARSRGLMRRTLAPRTRVKSPAAHTAPMPRLHIFPTSLVIEPSRTESGRSLWIDREKCTIEASDRNVSGGDLEKAQTHFIDGVAGIIKCAFRTSIADL